MNLTIALTAMVLVTVLSEWILWSIFRRKALPLNFPRRYDQSYFRFFDFKRLRIVAILHTIVLFVILIVLLVFLW